MAGIYNLGWGAYAGLDPQWLFRFTGMPAVLSATGEWPASSVVLCLTNDIVWWLPFTLYLRDAWPAFRSDLRAAA